MWYTTQFGLKICIHSMVRMSKNHAEFFWKKGFQPYPSLSLCLTLLTISTLQNPHLFAFQIRLYYKSECRAFSTSNFKCHFPIHLRLLEPLTTPPDSTNPSCSDTTSRCLQHWVLPSQSNSIASNLSPVSSFNTEAKHCFANSHLEEPKWKSLRLAFDFCWY